jgi:mannose-6-phosphate isomerase-like protein (cupin superfamily)
MQPNDELVLPPGAGQLVWLAGLGARFLLDGSHTGGRFALVEHVLRPRALGSPLHSHRNEDEFSFVLEGQVGVQVGSRELVAGPGSLVRKPRGVPHAFWNPTAAPARLLEIISPAGFEQYFAEVAEVFGSGAGDPGRAAALWRRYGLSMELASLPDLIERHGLADPSGQPPPG